MPDPLSGATRHTGRGSEIVGLIKFLAPRRKTELRKFLPQFLPSKMTKSHNLGMDLRVKNFQVHRPDIWRLKTTKSSQARKSKEQRDIENILPHQNLARLEVIFALWVIIPLKKGIMFFTYITQFVCLSVCLCVCLCVCLSVCVSVCLSSRLQRDGWT